MLDFLLLSDDSLRQTLNLLLRLLPLLLCVLLQFFRNCLAAQLLFLLKKCLMLPAAYLNLLFFMSNLAFFLRNHLL